MKTLRVGPNCWIDDDCSDAASLYYTEHSTDYWSGDTDTWVMIDKAKAKEIVEWLQEKFNMKGDDDKEAVCA